MFQSKPRRRSVTRYRTGILCAVALLAMASSQLAAAKEAAPADRTYFVVIVGLGAAGPYDVEAGCLTFEGSEFCTDGGETCLTWNRTQGGLQVRKQSGFSFLVELEEDGELVQISGQGRVDDRGKKSAISAVGRGRVNDQMINFSFAGREVRASRCPELVNEFLSGP